MAAEPCVASLAEQSDVDAADFSPAIFAEAERRKRPFQHIRAWSCA
tara:strand:+ start:10180 stop:10317 length:138 start_codon:yes stop_codon:yes gene_type:complete